MHPDRMGASISRRRVLAVASAVLLAVPLAVQATAGPALAAPRWVPTFGTAMTEGGTTDFTGTSYTVRNFVPASIGGTAVRVTLSNVFGGGTATFGRVTVAVANDASPRGTQSTPARLTFGGSGTVSVAAGGTATSDRLPFTVPAGVDLAISVFLSAAPQRATRHRSAYQHNHIAAGDHAADSTAASFIRSSTSWFYVTQVDVDTAAPKGGVVTFGDSITDGAGSTVNGDKRWPNALARRLQALPEANRLGVVNAGISGNQVLAATGDFGPSGVARAQRDIADRAGIRTVIVLEGINDIRKDPPVGVAQLWAGYEKIAATARTQGIRVIGGTLLPFNGGSKYTTAREQIRQQINVRIRQGMLYDGYVDFDAAVRDPADPTRMRATLHSGDWLHPNDAGYQTMANAVNLSIL
jgi:lysophospholipase L1-like esterase